jgi:hypothetical protein
VSKCSVYHIPFGEGIVLDLIPDAHRLSLTTIAIKEYIVMIIYQLQGGI